VARKQKTPQEKRLFIQPEIFGSTLSPRATAVPKDASFGEKNVKGALNKIL
jgi:hypothetical protein